ncbi:winged helix-turn-helix domain-containing protein [Diaphorobacter aerolatus]|uniref:Winged helix-turn-helix domain-containing protein n=1 Tax=Diaphorobacter aerolatus TaxID=1288495 RepID=A0A7H0GFP8_9BURK|nr:winged helix-turn-helix domain-containing protein [Diaphorobacter aerolatus]QNP47114.1 winged helix-turn-helix domain-containing protein [Diaphorobacter aerolatus]
MPARLLLVEDDPAIARTVIYTLEREGLHINHSLLLGDARTLIAGTRFDALILDVGLPDGNGLELLRELRQHAQHAAMPVLVLSAHGEEIDRVLGLELGADDYVAKPFSPRELAARVKGLLRRAVTSPPVATATVADANPFRDDALGQRMHFNGQPLALTRREYRLLSTLLAGAGRIHSRDHLLTAAWGDDSESTDRTIDTHIKTLRAKLRAVDASCEYISTHRGMGYSLEIAKG